MNLIFWQMELASKSLSWVQSRNRSITSALFVPAHLDLTDELSVKKIAWFIAFMYPNWPFPSKSTLKLFIGLTNLQHSFGFHVILSFMLIRYSHSWRGQTGTMKYCFKKRTNCLISSIDNSSLRILRTHSKASWQFDKSTGFFVHQVPPSPHTKRE